MLRACFDAPGLKTIDDLGATLPLILKKLQFTANKKGASLGLINLFFTQIINQVYNLKILLTSEVLLVFLHYNKH